MTIAVAMIECGSTYLGSDSLVTAEGGTWRLPDGKWVELECGLWVACAGSRRAAFLIEHLEDPEPDPIMLAEQIREAVKADAWKADEYPGAPPAFSYDALIAADGEVLYAAANGATIPFKPGYLAAIGSGRQYALGASFALPGISAWLTVKTAVQAAVAHDTECGAPLWFKVLE